MVFDSLSSNEAFARSAVAAFVMQLDPTIGEIGDIKTAVSEAVTNCVVHAYHGITGKIRLNVRFTSDHIVIIRISDEIVIDLSVLFPLKANESIVATS